jgi:hypothetical protein
VASEALQTDAMVIRTVHLVAQLDRMALEMALSVEVLPSMDKDTSGVTVKTLQSFQGVAIGPIPLSTRPADARPMLETMATFKQASLKIPNALPMPIMDPMWVRIPVSVAVTGIISWRCHRSRRRFERHKPAATMDGFGQ